MTGEELRERRIKLGLTQATLAELLGTTETTIRRNEKGQSPIANPTMLDLALQTLERKNEKRK